MSQDDRRRDVFAGIDHQKLDRHIRAFARRFIRSGVTVEDCAQETWIHIRVDPRRLPIDHGPEGLIAWLRIVVRNVAEDLARDERRHRAEPIETAALVHCPKDGPEVVCERFEILERLEFAVVDLQASVTEEEYRVFRLRRFEKKSWTEIAAEIGLTVDQVRYRYERADKELRLIARRRGLR